MNKNKTIAKHKRVIVFALDGVGRFFKKTDTPAIDAFFSSGTSWTNAKAVIPTDSAENWGSLLTGALPIHKHLLNLQELEAGKSYENHSYPTIFRILSENLPGIKMASYASWWPINTGMIEEWIKVDRYSPNIHGNVFWRYWIKFKHYWLNDSTCDSYLVPQLVEYIRDPKNNDVELLFIHLTDVDEYGHSHGYGLPRYLNQIKIMDEQIATILEAIDEAGWKDDSLIIMTTDHGGINETDSNGVIKGGKHGEDSDDEVNVFLVARGKGFEPGLKVEKEITNMDCAAIILKGLGVGIPQNFDAKLPMLFPLSDFTIRSGSEIIVGEAVLNAYIDHKKSTNLSCLHFDGWCSKEWKQKMEEKFSKKNLLKEVPTSKHSESVGESSVELNVMDTDATLIIFPYIASEATIETQLAQQTIKKFSKLNIIVFLSGEEIQNEDDADQIVNWIFRNQINSLNVISSIKEESSDSDQKKLKSQVNQLITKILEKIESKIQEQSWGYQDNIEILPK